MRAERAERREEGARAWAALAAELGRSGTRARLRWSSGRGKRERGRGPGKGLGLSGPGF